MGPFQPKPIVMSAVKLTTGGAIRTHPWTRGNRLVGYDPNRKRMWVAGQRLHHGATGIALGVAGILLVAHDWKDRSKWFRFGPQSD
jgi:hypothetical protein